MAMRRRGWTLVEIMVAVMLLATALMMVLSLMPTGILSLKQAENVQTATAFGEGLLEGAPIPESFPVAEEEIRQTINGTEFVATRSYQKLTDTSYDVRVKIEWSTGRQPLEMRLRRFVPYSVLFRKMA